MCISRGGEACFRCQALPVTNYEYCAELRGRGGVS
jgi:hypothetical protein